MDPLPIELGIVEGYYGRPWTWAERARVVATLAPHGWRTFVYAPKAATALRRRWRDDMDDAALAPIAAFAAHCRAHGTRFGLGLSPHEFDDAPGSPDWATLERKLAALDDAAAPDLLALLFDDIRGDDPRLADRQAAIVAFARERCRAPRLMVCPSYYSDDPVLDLVFGARPEGYLERLGERLDPSVGVFWTGEEVCSREYGAAHLRRVAGTLRRRPVLWDNYPVNDGQRMSQALHLRGSTGRPASNAPLLAAHFANPALQPVLGCIPLLTLAERYRVGDADYAYGEAFARACRTVLGDGPLADAVALDLIRLQDTGLDRLGELAPALRARYAAFDHPAAREIVDWLDGGWRITDEIVRTQ
ncbi:MAG TPA: beta-N-acetylglucosaminidase domain-containing protein [Burkholderiaceae bacterium]|nr:beta-N-acetylglucosaminidase domain-containing protein [Burkholderiaceae bacterium]